MKAMVSNRAIKDTLLILRCCLYLRFLFPMITPQ